MLTDFYQILDLDENANLRTIKLAYKKKALQIHPDRNSDPMASQMFQQIHEAYLILKNPRSRFEYNEFRRRQKNLLMKRKIINNQFSNNDKNDFQNYTQSKTSAVYTTFYPDNVREDGVGDDFESKLKTMKIKKK